MNGKVSDICVMCHWHFNEEIPFIVSGENAIQYTVLRQHIFKNINLCLTLCFYNIFTTEIVFHLVSVYKYSQEVIKILRMRMQMYAPNVGIKQL